MTNYIIKSIPAVLCGFLIAFYLYTGTAIARDNNKGHHGPPPEAYTACEGKSEGDTAEFESPRGDMVTGTCIIEGDRLVLRPDNPPERRKSGGRND